MVSVRPWEAVALVTQDPREDCKLRVERAIQEWLTTSPDGLAVVAYHKERLNPWDDVHALPFIPFHHSHSDRVYKHCLLPFSTEELSFHDAWRLLGQTGGLIETLKAELLAPFIPSHLFAQSQSSNSPDKDWQDIFSESRQRLQRVEQANTLEKLLSFAPHD
jgi:hypothetical protein